MGRDARNLRADGLDLWWRRHAKRLIVVGAAGLLVAAGLLAGCAGDEKPDTTGSLPITQVQQTGAVGQQAAVIGAKDTVTVTGKAKVTAAPDQAVLVLSVESDGADAAKALDANSASMQKVMDKLKAEGVNPSAIETSNVTVYPIRTYDPQSGKESLSGYRAQNMIKVTLKDALTVGKVIAAAIETGATNINGPEWKLSDDNAAVTEALKKAVADARTKAEAVAQAQGVRLGDVIMMNESGVEVPVVPVYAAAAEGVADSTKVAAPPISAASLDVTASITVTYALTK